MGTVQWWRLRCLVLGFWLLERSCRMDYNRGSSGDRAGSCCGTAIVSRLSRRYGHNAVRSRRLVQGAAVGVSSREGFQRWELPCCHLPFSCCRIERWGLFAPAADTQRRCKSHLLGIQHGHMTSERGVPETFIVWTLDRQFVAISVVGMIGRKPNNSVIESRAPEASAPSCLRI